MKALRTLLALLLLQVAASAQPNPQIEQAKKAFNAGQAAYDLAKYDEALTHFTRAYELSRLPAVLYNVGQAHRRLYETGGNLDNLVRAREMYRSFLRLAPQSPDRPMAESLLRDVETEYQKQLRAQRDKMLVEAKGAAALALAEDLADKADLDGASTALERFVKSPGNTRAEVARGERVRARVQAARGDAKASAQSFARALELDPAVSPPPPGEQAAVAAFARAQERMKGRPSLTLAHVPPARLKVGQAPRLRVDVGGDTLALVSGLKLRYRAGAGAWATLDTKPGEVVFPGTFNQGLQPGTRIEYWVTAVDEDGAVLDTLGSDNLPFILNVDAKAEKPLHKRWQLWVGVGAAVVVAAGIAAGVGVALAPPERIPIPVNTSLISR
jgi:tetratricopeptide (TPR) repeat protein